MSCKICSNEKKKREIVKDYFRTWKWWFLSVIGCLVLVSFSKFILGSTLTDFSIPILISIIIMYLVLMIFPFFCFIKMGPGLLSLSTLLMFVMCISTPDEGLNAIMKLSISASVILFSLDVLMGVNFIFHAKVQERPWSFQNSTPRRDIKKGSRKK